MKEFKIRASAISDIMSGSIGLTEIQQQSLADLEKKKLDKGLTAIQANELQRLLNKKANPDYPAGMKTYCKMWVKQEIYQRKKEFTSKYTEKGQQVELHSFEVIRKHLGLERINKNDEFFENDFITGTPDIIEGEHLIDAKSPWDCFTFPLFDDELPSDEYYWQGQGYMDLTGKSLCKFIYVLCDTPEKLIINEAKSYCYKNGFELSPELVDEFRERLTYPSIPDEYKIKVFEVKRNDSDIRKIHDRVKACRTYIKNYLTIKKTYNEKQNLLS